MSELATFIELYQQGHLDRAALAAEELIGAAPQQADVHNVLGVINASRDRR